MLSRQDLRQQGIATLPESLGEAVELFAESELMRATLGDHIHSYLVAAKRAEWTTTRGTCRSGSATATSRCCDVREEGPCSASR
mgnify:CR=1 FL=1